MAFSSQVPIFMRPKDKSDPALQGVNLDMGALTSRAHKKHKTAQAEDFGATESSLAH